MSKIEYMKVIATSLSPFPNLLRDLKNNLTFGKFIWFFIYSIFVLYISQISNRILGSGNINTQFMLSLILYIQEIPILLFVFFYLKTIYLKIALNRKEVSSLVGLIDNNSKNIYSFKIFLFSVFIFYLLFSFLEIYQYNYALFFIIKLFLLVYLIPLLPFIIIEKPNISYFLSFQIIVKAIRLQFFKILLVIFITTIIYEIICILLYYFPQVCMLYLAVVSNGQDATVGEVMAIASICNLVPIYIGIIIYTKLSLEIYLKFKNRILSEITKINNKSY